MRCVKCGETISSTQCRSCGYDHSRGGIHFLDQPDPEDIRIQRKTAPSGVSEEEVSADSQYNLGKAFFQSEKYDQAAHWLLTPAKKGNREAQRLLGYLYEVSEAHKDPDKAAFWYEQAAARGERGAVEALIRIYKAAGAAKRDKLRYWEEKKQKMGAGTIDPNFKRQLEAKAARDFEIKDGVLVKYTGKSSHPVIPRGVREIGEDVFRGNDVIESVTLPEGVEKIGPCAFAECPLLETVKLPKSLRTIELFAFFESPVRSMELPAGLCSIGDEGTFCDTDLRRVTVPGGVKTIPGQAFSGCRRLKEVILQDGVTEIEYDAFAQCTDLETIHIPDSVIRIADGTDFGGPAFFNCLKLTKVVASDAWKANHRDFLKKVLPIQPEEVPWCREAATQGSLEDMRKLIHWYHANQNSPADAEQLKMWKAKEEFVSWYGSLFQLGNRYYPTDGEKDRTLGFQRHMDLANRGDAYAQLWIGDCYFYGRGIAENKEEAVKWYKAAAAQGYAEAQYWLGYCYANGFGVEMDEAMASHWLHKALLWIRRAADRGYGKEQCMLGECYFWGYGVTRNRSTAVSWFRKAAEQGYGDAQYWLGMCYAGGWGVRKDLKEAAKWNTEATRNSHPGAWVKYKNNEYSTKAGT